MTHATSDIELRLFSLYEELRDEAQKGANRHTVTIEARIDELRWVLELDRKPKQK